MKRSHRRRTTRWGVTARSPTMVTLHDTRFVECRWWSDGWTVKTVVTLTVVGLCDTGPWCQRKAWLSWWGGYCDWVLGVRRLHDHGRSGDEWSESLSVCLSVCLSLSLSLSACLSASVCLSVCLYLSVCLHVFLSASLSLSLSPLSLSLSHRLVGLVVKASASGTEDPGFESRLHRDLFRGRVIPVTSKLALQWLPCQTLGFIRSALGLAGPVSAYCGCVK